MINLNQFFIKVLKIRYNSYKVEKIGSSSVNKLCKNEE